MEQAVARRVRFLRRSGRAEMLVALRHLPGRLKKHNPLDCGRPGCKLCHRDKIFDDSRRDEALADLKMREGLRETILDSD